jgi:hypothetical protein
VNESAKGNAEREGASQDALRSYMLAAAALLVVIVVVAILIVTVGLPALRGEGRQTVVTIRTASATRVPTSTASLSPGPTPTPSPWSTMPALVMIDTDDPAFEFVSAGGRPSLEWTGFFGRVLDADGRPLPGAPVVIWTEAGQPVVPPARTDESGNYEIRLAGAPQAGVWTIQVLTAEGQPASKLFTFQTDADTQTGIQQIQVVWARVP